MARQKLKLLLDENIGAVPAVALRQRGYDVVSIAESHVGVSDADVLALAVAEKRIVVTLDHDFGVLVFMHRSAHCGVVLLRLKKESPAAISRLLIDILSAHGAHLAGAFTVANETTVRIRRNR